MKIGIFGAGQLAKMLAQAAYELDQDILCYANEHNLCASKIAKTIVSAVDDFDSINNFCDMCDVITYETENILLEKILELKNNKNSLKNFEKILNIRALEIFQDRFLEKNFLNQLNIPTTKFYLINEQCKLDLLCASLDFNSSYLLKKIKGGYDGKGQFLIDSKNDLESILNKYPNCDFLLEECVKFDKEISITAARSFDGKVSRYAISKNKHQNGILVHSFAPYEDNNVLDKATVYIKKILENLNYIGVMTVECFICGDVLLVNEVAPRVHNSGHWTIEGAYTSQFENHIRAIAGLPLGSTISNGYSSMHNIIGKYPDIKNILNLENAHLHMYGKEPQVGRKIGHVTINAQSQDLVEKSAEELAKFL